MNDITVLKKNLAGEVTWQYAGRVLIRELNFIKLEAFFDREDMPFMDAVLKRNDRFVEAFYNDRWYNIFEIYDRDEHSLKGWYCNVCFPAVFSESAVSYVDLALDLWVSAGGAQSVLDMDEFEALDLNPDTRMKALAALDVLRERFTKQKPLE